MTAQCPKCGVSIKPFAVRPRFVCRFCSAPLKGQIVAPLIWAIAIWQLTEIFFHPLFRQLAGDTWTAFTMRTLVCTWIGVYLYMVLISECDSVQIADNETQPHNHSSKQETDANSQRETT
jgi:hypothetical protein